MDIEGFNMSKLRLGNFAVLGIWKPLFALIAGAGFLTGMSRATKFWLSSILSKTIK